MTVHATNICTANELAAIYLLPTSQSLWCLPNCAKTGGVYGPTLRDDNGTLNARQANGVHAANSHSKTHMDEPVESEQQPAAGSADVCSLPNPFSVLLGPHSASAALCVFSVSVTLKTTFTVFN